MNEPAQQPASPDFDPIQGVFIAMDQRPASLTPVSFRELTPFQRALLVIDGTVTRFMEAYAAERVEVLRIDQQSAPAAGSAKWLQCAPVEVAVYRQVALAGVQSGNLYAYAESVILPQRLTPGMRAGVAAEPGGLGRIMVENQLESRREALWYGRERLEKLPDIVAARCDSNFLTRSYRVIAAGQPLMLITERFPFSGQ